MTRRWLAIEMGKATPFAIVAKSTKRWVVGELTTPGTGGLG